MERTAETASTDQTVRAAVAGDEPAFAALAERHRRELHVHCYRMLASFDEAEDAVQETFLHAWRGRSGFDGADSIGPLMAEAAAMGEWRVIPTAANRMPAAAGYLRRPGDSEFRALKLDVMRIEAGVIAEITVFNADLFPALGLPPAL
jgi:hypothetical protein